MAQESKTVKRYRRKVVKLTQDLDKSEYKLGLAGDEISELKDQIKILTDVEKESVESDS